MVATKVLTALVILLLAKPSFHQTIQENVVEPEDINPLAEAAADIFKEQNLQNIGGMVNNLIQSGGAKQLGDMLMSATGNENAGQLLQGLGSLLGDQAQNVDPNLLGTVMNLMASQQSETKRSGGDSGFNPNILMSLLGNIMSDPDSAQGFMSYVPLIMETVNSFMGPEAEEREKKHSDHSWLLPPVLEKLHVLFDHFMHSDLGKKFINTLGAEKFVKIFSDENGNLSYRKFVDMMENHSFRRHWIRMVTNRIALMISYLADPKIQKKYLSNGQHFINSVLKSQGYPKSTLFDPARATETLTALANHFVKKTFTMKIDAKQYVKPAVEYVKELFRLAQQKGILMGSAVDSRQLSDKLADTINMEVIEPIARVNRAYRFAKKVPECDRYVMCLVNQKNDNEPASLPGLKPMLSKGASLILSWFLPKHTGTSFWTLYNVITDENNCQARFVDSCHDFHLEEVKVTTEYVHNEL